MGLDMYLTKVKKEEIGYWRKANAIHRWFEQHCSEEGIIENCKPVYVSKEDLIQLRDDCQKVLDSSKLTYKPITVQQWNSDKRENEEVQRMVEVLEDTSVAQDLLPTQSGFFFGGTLYDKWYVESLKQTVSMIDEILENVDFDEYGIEYSAWW